MTKWFFLLSSMNVGGVEKAFLGILSTLSPKDNDVHLGLLQKKGGFLEDIPEWVQIHEVSVYQPYWRQINDPPMWHIQQQLSLLHWGDAFIHLVLYALFKLTGSQYWFYRWLLRKEPMMNEEYDIAVAFAGPSQMIDYYICEKVNAKKKYGWIHFDISRFGIDRGMTRRLYRQYEKIFVVSQEARDIFCRIFPELAGKTEVFYNIVNFDLIRHLSESAPTFNDGFTGNRLLTVGRISPEKGQQIAVHAMKQIIDKHPKTRWYFVGEGKSMEACQALVHKEGLDEVVVFLGLQKNPYGYMRDCDLYVQPSRHEGYCITLAEALSFNKPVVVTGFSGAREQLVGKSDAWVADFSPDSLAARINDALLFLDYHSTDKN